MISDGKDHTISQHNESTLGKGADYLIQASAPVPQVIFRICLLLVYCRGLTSYVM